MSFDRFCRFMSNAIADDLGASVVELALSAPLLIFLAIGTIEVGTFMYDGIEVANAAHAGVAYATQGSASALGATYLDTPGIIAATFADAKDVTLTSPTTSDVFVTYRCDSKPNNEFTTPPTNCPTSDHVDTFVKVIAAGTFTSFLNFPGIPNTVTVTRTAYQQVTP